MAAREERTLQITGRFRDQMSQNLKRVRARVKQVSDAFKQFRTVVLFPVAAPLKLLDKLANKLLSVRNVVLGFFAVQAGRQAFAAFTGIADELDRIAKVAGRLQATTESVSSLAFIAQSAGTNLEELRPGLLAFSRNIETARVATGAQRDALAALGIRIEDVRTGNLDLIDILARTAEGYTKLRSATERVTVSTTLFGEAGGAIAPLLGQGAEAVRELDRVARESGVVFSREQLARVEAFNDALLKVQTAFRGAFSTFFIEIAPGLAGFFERLGQLVRENRAQITEFLTSLARGFASFTVGAIRGILSIAEVLENVLRDFGLLDADLEQRIQRIDSLITTLTPVSGFGSETIVGLAEERARLEELRKNGIAVSLRADFETFIADIEGLADQIAIPAPESAAAAGREAAARFAAEFDDALRARSVSDARSALVGRVDTLQAERSILALRNQTETVRLGLVSIDSELQTLDFRSAFEQGKISAEQFAAATRAVANRAREDVEQIGIDAERQFLGFQRSLLDLQEPSRGVDLALANIDRTVQELEFRQAFAEGRIGAAELERALALVGEQAERIESRIRGDFAGGFEDAGRRALRSFTDLTAFGTDAANSLVNQGLGGLSNALGDVITRTQSTKEAFRSFATETLRLVGQHNARFITLRIVSALASSGGASFAEGGIMPGRMQRPRGVTLRKYQFGGVARSPQVAVFGEGRQAEAFVPLPDGRRIPVEMRGGGGGGGLTIVVQTVDSRDTARWFLENRGTILGITRNGFETSFGQRQAVQGAVR